MKTFAHAAAWNGHLSKSNFYAFLNIKFKNASTKPILIDFIDEAWLTLESLSHEIRS